VSRPRPRSFRTPPDRRTPYRTVLAFLIAPIVSAGVWYVLRLVHLAVANGELRWRADVLALLVGAVLFGIPLAAIVTWVAGAPVYLVLSRLGWLRFQVVLAAGAGLGLVTAVALAWHTGDRSLLHPVLAAVVGTATAGIWWWMLGQSSASSSRRASSSSRRSSSETSG
jgi:hypothetical protein